MTRDDEQNTIPPQQQNVDDPDLTMPGRRERKPTGVMSLAI